VTIVAVRFKKFSNERFRHKKFMFNPFAVLGVAPGASAESIRAAFTRLSTDYASDPAMAARLSQAYSILTNPNSSPEHATFDQLFDRFYSGSPQPPSADFSRAPTRSTDSSSLDIHVVVNCTLEEMYNQAVKLLTFVRRRESGACETKTIKITLTDGTEDHTTISLPKQGHRDLGKPPGNLMITILQQPHLRFSRVGADLFEPVVVSLRDAISRNCELRSIGVDGEEVVLVVGGVVQSGEEVRAVNRGMKRKDGTRGDHVFQVKVTIPPLTPMQRSLLVGILTGS
jgi:DnaJ-class molecular chaperone